jgi:hypothetical protein
MSLGSQFSADSGEDGGRDHMTITPAHRRHRFGHSVHITQQRQSVRFGTEPAVFDAIVLSQILLEQA